MDPAASSTLTSVELLRAARRGETDALEALYREHASMVYGVALRLTGAPDEADDVLQDVFVGLPRALGTFEGRGSFGGWLRQVTARTALMRLRNGRVTATRPLDERAPAHRAGDIVDRIALERAIQALPDTLRAVFVLREVEGMSYDDVAATLGIRKAACEVRLHRARRRLRQLLEDR